MNLPSLDNVKMYKYRPWDQHCESLILDSHIYFSKPADLNDPFDCRFPIIRQPSKNEFLSYLKFQSINANLIGLSCSYCIDDINDHISILPGHLLDKIWMKIIQQSEESILHQSAVYCLTELNDNILMYSHYANGHTGLCFEFSFTLGHFIGNPEAVSYQDEYPVADLFKDESCGNVELAVATMFTKARIWEYEKEWRIFESNSLPGIRKFDPRCLTGIIFGCKCPAETRKRVFEIVKERPYPLQIYEAIPADSNYALKIHPVR